MRRLISNFALAFSVLSASAALANDQQLADAIAKRFEASGQMKGYSVGVKVEQGTAWLGGRVGSQEQMVTALSIAKSTEGIDRVINNLTIVPTPTSRKLAGALQQPGAIANQPAEIAQQQSLAPRGGPVVRASAELPRQSMDLAKQVSHEADHFSGPVAPAEEDGPDMFSRLQAESSAGPGIAENANIPMAVRQPLPVSLSSASNQSAGQQAPPRELAPQQSSRQAAAPMPSNARSRQSGRAPLRQPMPLAMNNGMYGPGPGADMSMMGGPESVGAPRPMPMHVPSGPGAVAPYSYDHPQMPGYAWPSYAAYPNYASLTYPKQYSPTAWPYIGPFYPYPQVPLGWRKVSLEWDDGWWFLDFKDHH